MIDPATNDQRNSIQSFNSTAKILKDFWSCFSLEIGLAVLGAKDKMVKQLMVCAGHLYAHILSPLPGLWQGIVLHPMAVAIGSSSIAPIGALGMVVQTIRKLFHHS